MAQSWEKYDLDLRSERVELGISKSVNEMQNKLRFFRKFVEVVTRETREGILKERESSKSLNVI